MLKLVMNTSDIFYIMVGCMLAVVLPHDEVAMQGSTKLHVSVTDHWK